MNLRGFSFGGTSRLVVAGITFILLILLINTSFKNLREAPSAANFPATDFSFIKRFYCISDLFSKEQWHDNKGRSFDEEGVHLTNLKKHPVNACHYALFCFDEFKSTGDSVYYVAFMDQVKYLLDTASYHVVDDDKIAYPYSIKFHDLNPPWYSALAQSEAISVLIRYYALSGDTAVLPVIVKLRNFMVSPQEFGCGTMSITPEGNEWYEEYPNSKQERQVLNGFFLSIVALHEYTHLFPADTATKRMYEASINTVKKSFKYYDTGTWLKYNRGDGRQVSNGYMKWQVLEMKLLHELTGDIYFKHLMMLAASYCFNKPYEAAGSKLQDYDFSVPLTPGKNGMLGLEAKNKKVIVNAANSSLNTSFGNSQKEMLKIIDDNNNTFTTFKYNDSTGNSKHYITFNLKAKAAIGSCSISFMGLDSLAKPQVSFLYNDSLNQIRPSKAVILSSDEKDPKSVSYKIKQVEVQSFTVVIENMNVFRDIKVSNLAFYYEVKTMPGDFMHYLTPVYEAGKDRVSFDFENKGMKSVAVFHKSANDIKSLDKEKWDPLNVRTKMPVVLLAPKHQFHRFLVVCEPQKSTASIGKVSFTSN